MTPIVGAVRTQAVGVGLRAGLVAQGIALSIGIRWKRGKIARDEIVQRVRRSALFQVVGAERQRRL